MPGPRRQPKLGALHSSKGFYEPTKRLSDYNGDFYLHLTCHYCRHDGELSAKDLAARFGKNTELSKVEEHLYCKPCGRKDFDLRLTFDHKPRGWNPRR